jgi:frizzled protein 5/8
MDERSGEEPPKGGTSPAVKHPVPGGPEPQPCSTCNECPLPLLRVKDNGTETNGVPSCALPCRIYSTEEEVTFSTYWLGVWSGLCFGTTLLTLITFAVDRARWVDLVPLYP